MSTSTVWGAACDARVHAGFVQLNDNELNLAVGAINKACVSTESAPTPYQSYITTLQNAYTEATASLTPAQIKQLQLAMQNTQVTVNLFFPGGRAAHAGDQWYTVTMSLADFMNDPTAALTPAEAKELTASRGRIEATLAPHQTNPLPNFG